MFKWRALILATFVLMAVGVDESHAQAADEMPREEGGLLREEVTAWAFDWLVELQEQWEGRSDRSRNEWILEAEDRRTVSSSDGPTDEAGGLMDPFGEPAASGSEPNGEPTDEAGGLMEPFG